MFCVLIRVPPRLEQFHRGAQCFCSNISTINKEASSTRLSNCFCLLLNFSSFQSLVLYIWEVNFVCCVWLTQLTYVRTNYFIRIINLWLMFLDWTSKAFNKKKETVLNYVTVKGEIGLDINLWISVTRVWTNPTRY